MFKTDLQLPETRLAQLGLQLPDLPPEPIGAFCNVRIHNDLAYVSGQGAVTSDGKLLCGKVGADVDADTARVHAKLVAVNMLASLRAELGSLDKVTGVIKLLGLVNATADFERHPYVIDGASTLLAEIFGIRGVHARSSFGVGSLPNQITVEIEGIFSLEVCDG
ncbi:MAG: RidA family protein [Rhodobacteraceae bacterium]|nr:RidA family protein [Paracoccaceae bacterium]MCY4196103.1 RidA family protein [Paracoccaceae bacterium]